MKRPSPRFGSSLDLAKSAGAVIQESDDPAEVAEAQNLIREMLTANLIERDDSLEFIVPLIESGNLPLDVNLMVCQSYLLTNPELAGKAAELVLSADPLPVGLFATVQPVARSEAALALFDAEFARLTSELTDPDQSGNLDLSDLEGYKTLVSEGFQGDPNQASVDLYTQGSIDMLSDNVALARSKFMEISTVRSCNDPACNSDFCPASSRAPRSVVSAVWPSKSLASTSRTSLKTRPRACAPPMPASWSGSVAFRMQPPRSVPFSRSNRQPSGSGGSGGAQSPVATSAPLRGDTNRR